jgi:hypothetical protein
MSMYGLIKKPKIIPPINVIIVCCAIVIYFLLYKSQLKQKDVINKFTITNM